jgi:uncharacterized protein
MPEYLAIAGVATSTAGFAGLARYGPVRYPGGPIVASPLVESFATFERLYGGLESLHVAGGSRVAYLAHAARAFFINGGTRLYVSRVYVPRQVGGKPHFGVGRFSIPVSGTHATWRARWPGKYGNASVAVHVVRGPNAAYRATEFDGAIQVEGVERGALVEVTPARSHVHAEAVTLGRLAQISIDAHDGRQVFNRHGSSFTPADTDLIRHITLTVTVTTDDKRARVYNGLETNPQTTHYIGTVLGRDDPADPESVVYLDWDPTLSTERDVAASLLMALVAQSGATLKHGDDGAEPSASALEGSTDTTGLAALRDIDSIAVVALPDAAVLANHDETHAANAALIAHAESLRYRIAVLDSPQGSSIDDVRGFRGQFDTAYGALYYPWVEVDHLILPPSGFVCGVYARTDAERGVQKAPANEAVRGVKQLHESITDSQQEVLNHEGINALRSFPDRGILVWGARTMSADPEWKYVNVRRLFIFLEHSIDLGLQWVVFEPNGESLWSRVRSAVEDFLFNEWKSGALPGAWPEEAFFVKCDRTTMTQDDIDNGRLVCLVGVAPVRPAEFVIFRIGQWTRSRRDPP